MATSHADQMRFLATVKRQSAPPRCNPFAIVAQVLALGMIFIGLTMTIIAHWPGSTSIGENPLKIAGPILLCVGFAVFLIGVIVVCVLNKREQRKWEKTVAQIAAKRQPPVDGTTVVGETTAVPVRSSVQETGFTKKPLNSDDVVDVPQYLAEKPLRGVGLSHDPNSSSFTDGDNVPTPLRVKKSRPPKRMDDQDVSVDADDFAPATTTVHETVTTQVVEETVTRTKHRKPKTVTAEVGSTEESQALMSQPAVSASPSQAKRLHVHVKAQPGATVRIHQAAPPPVAPKPGFASKHNQSTTSGETDI